MRLLGTDGRRLFVTCWILYAAHFATNVVREHYPAFALAEKGTLRVDDYMVDEQRGLHSDIFRHTDGHAYIDNNVAASVVAAVPLFLLDPLLDALEARRKAENARPGGGTGGAIQGEYRTEYPLRAEFYREVRRRGLDLRFGAAAAITSVYLMAPLSALSAALVLGFLRRRGLPRGRAIALSLVYAFGTPVFFRTATLNNNLMVMHAVMGAFLLLEAGAGSGLLAGLLAGAAVAFDYSGLVPLACLFGWVLVEKRSLRAMLPFAAGALPPLVFLALTQWLQFGNPWLPAQHWMPAAHFTDLGWRGFSLPQPDLFLENLVGRNWGLFAYGPILLLALLPPPRVPDERRILTKRAWRFVLVLSIAFMLFCASNQYGRMQWNSGVRYVLPIVPLVYLAACERLASMPARWLAPVAGLAVAHEWVLAMVRYHVQPHELDQSSVVESWRRFLHAGVQLPWLNVLRRTAPEGALVQAWFWPWIVLLACALLVVLVWRAPAARMADGA